MNLSMRKYLEVRAGIIIKVPNDLSAKNRAELGLGFIGRLVCCKSFVKKLPDEECDDEDVEEEDAHGGEEAEGSQNGHALRKKGSFRVTGFESFFNISFKHVL